MRKVRREFDSFSGQESSIADMKKAADQYRVIIAEKDRELRTFDEQLKVVNAELTKLSSIRSANQGKIKTLMQNRDAFRKQIDAQYEAKNIAYEEFQKAQAAHRIWMQAEQVKWEEAHVQREIDNAIRDLENDLRKLELPACSDQIEQCLNIQTYLRVNVLKAPVTLGGENTATSAATTLRQVEKVSSDLILKKEQVEDNYSIGSKKSKGKKVTVKEPTSSQTVKLPFWVISALNELKINMVTNIEEAKQAIEALDKVKASFEQVQKSKMANVDAEREAIQARIEKQKARIPNISQEAANRIKANVSARKAVAAKAGLGDAAADTSSTAAEN